MLARNDTFASDLCEQLPHLYKFAIKLCRNTTKADDLTQETAARAWAHRDQFTVGTNLGAWLFTIMRNTFYGQVRQEKSHRGEYNPDDLSFCEALDELDPSRYLEAKEELQLLKKLPDFQQEAILMRVDGLTYDQIAKKTGVEDGTAKSRVWRGRERLAELANVPVR